jgi:hypothetical protein
VRAGRVRERELRVGVRAVRGLRARLRAGRALRAWETALPACKTNTALLEFGRFFTCNACRQRNKKAKQARQARHRATYKVVKATGEEIERSIQARARLTGEYKLRGKFTRLLTIKDYLNKSSFK